MTYYRHRQDAPTRSVTDVGPGDFVKVDHGWMPIAKNSAYGKDPAPREWTIETTDGETYGMFDIYLYAKYGDMNFAR